MTLDINFADLFIVVLISPSSLDGIYTVEVQREIQISCTAAIPRIVQWASKYIIR